MQTLIEVKKTGMKKMRNIKLDKQVVRELQKQDGAFDGRYRTRKIKNKKREALRKACRGKVVFA